MRLAGKELPDVGELVIGTVRKIADHGAYVHLDEYDVEAFAPIHEIVQSWFHSIRDYVKEGLKTVFKVVSVNPRMRVVEVSLKRVRPEDKERKMLAYRRKIRALKIIEIAMQRLNRPGEGALKVLWLLEEHFGDPFKAFEEVARAGPEALERLELDGELKAALVELAVQHVETPTVRVSGIIKAASIDGNGVEKLRGAFEELARALRGKFPDLSFKVYAVGPPRYRIDITGRGARRVEAAFNEAKNILQALQKKYNIIASLQRLEGG
jgi:translation initiation factor 2 subunit 1